MNPFAVLAFLFIAVPVLEIYLLIKVGTLIGAGWTIFLVVLTAVVGANLLRQQGLSTLKRARATLDKGQLPAQEILEGLALAIGGALLLTPGFFTDSIGLLCLLPTTRLAMVKFLLSRMNIINFSTQIRTAGEPRGFRDQNRTIDGEYRRDD